MCIFRLATEVTQKDREHCSVLKRWIEAGAQEVHVSALMPKSFGKSQAGGQYLDHGMFRVKDRNERGALFGTYFTKEAFTYIVRNEILQHLQGPFQKFCIKFKQSFSVMKEGLYGLGFMRCREFTMKDAYCF